MAITLKLTNLLGLPIAVRCFRRYFVALVRSVLGFASVISSLSNVKTDEPLHMTEVEASASHSSLRWTGCGQTKTKVVLIWCIHLVDPASSHMLVSKIKPCMCKFKPLYGKTANGSLKQL